MLDELTEFNKSEVASFLRKRDGQVNKEKNAKSLIHGKNHADRVSLLSMMIAKDEGIFNYSNLEEKKEAERRMEILSYAAYYHDIGRIGDTGPHAKRSARRINRMDLIDINGKKLDDKDKNIIKMLVELHEARDDKFERYCTKYNIANEDKAMALDLSKCLKDADALDRCRLDVKILSNHPDLNPKYLRTNSAKQMLDLSYGLEYLSGKVKFNEVIKFGCNEHDINRYVSVEETKEAEERDKFRTNLREKVEIGNVEKQKENEIANNKETEMEYNKEEKGEYKE